MAIIIDNEKQLFTLHTKNSTYQMKVGLYGVLLHTYYGARVDGQDLSYLIQQQDRGFSGNPDEAGSNRTFSVDTLPQEYSTFGVGDYRESCLDVVQADGSVAADLRYSSYRIEKGTASLAGLPAVRSEDRGEETLYIMLTDTASPITVELAYVVLPECDVIARSARIINHGAAPVKLKRALSCCLDFNLPASWQMLSFYGRHAGERNLSRINLYHGKSRIDSVRGGSSHHQNPFIILCSLDATETNGLCYSMSFVYSGNFIAQAEIDQIGQMRTVMGIHPQGFEWQLNPDEDFQTPQVLCSMSADGFDRLSNNLHKAILTHIIRKPFANTRPPILVNNWEATYFDFDKEKLLNIAREAKNLGIEMLVVDDGWFGHRNNDESSLGDWYVNEKKLQGGLTELSKELQDMGMQLGIWFEPEMISHDSDLYRLHPEWQIQCPGRKSVKSRCQYVLDMGREDVRDYLFERISEILHATSCKYVKWDMNRHLANVWSAVLPADRQGEVWHRYVLGVYDLLERLLTEHPDLLIEGCSGGGGRYDAGMLYYTPQIWCSDNTDAIDRISIQLNTSFGYPVRTMGSHVSVCPNHQTGRISPINTRGNVAMLGTFGYELDLCKLSDEDKEAVKQQVLEYKRQFVINCEGSLHRLVLPSERKRFSAWMTVSEDKTQAIVTCVLLKAQANGDQIWFRLRGLDPAANYTVVETGECYTGQALMQCGMVMPVLREEYGAVQFHLRAVAPDDFGV